MRKGRVRADQQLTEVRDLYKALNYNMEEFRKAKVTSNDLDMYKDMLRDFYEKNDIRVKNKERFTWQAGMTQEQADELLDIAMSMARDPYTDLQTYEDLLGYSAEELNVQDTYTQINLDAFKKISERYDDIQDFQDYVNFIDKMNDFKSNRLLSQILESDQIAELYSVGSWEGLSAEDIDELISTEYSISGRTGDALYSSILDAIDSYDYVTGEFK